MAVSGWWRCPSEPPCPHSGLLHDIESFEDPKPMCCAGDCLCGKTQLPLGAVLT